MLGCQRGRCTVSSLHAGRAIVHVLNVRANRRGFRRSIVQSYFPE